jgi:uncharacterized membrane protein HdeD (DUF308 family)
MADTTVAVAAPAPGSSAPPLVPWWLVLLQGIAAIIIGLMLLTNPAATTLVIVQVLGWYWLFTGVMNLVLIFVDNTMWGWKLVIGVLGIMAGVFVIKHPIYSGILIPTTLVVVLGIEGLIIGVVDIVKAFKGGGWGIGFLGLFSILIGGMLLARPYMAALATPTVFGILGLVFGIGGIFAAFGLRKAQA